MEESLFIYIVGFIIIIIGLLHSKKSAAKDKKKTGQTGHSGTPQNSAGKIYSYAKKSDHDVPVKVYGGLKKDGKVSASLKDDRNNDWLAGQMREERNSLVSLKDMFGFQMEGKRFSDAELLKEFHMEHCDAQKVDKAAGK